MTSVEEFNLRLSATKDVLVGLQKSELALAPLQESELRSRARTLVGFLAGMDTATTPPPAWFIDVAASAEDYLLECLRGSMSAHRRAPIASAPPQDSSLNPKHRPWWCFWRC
jgi:hypothetical protein